MGSSGRLVQTASNDDEQPVSVTGLLRGA